jgi:hypothetical protein
MQNVAKIIRARGGFQQLARQHIRLEVEGFMPLAIEHLGPSPHGAGLVLVSVTHYGEQNGDAMRDPDMVFDVNPETYEVGDWRPVSFRNDYVGSYQEAVFVRDGSVLVRPGLVRELKSFARIWDSNLKEQGFVRSALEGKCEVL